VLLVAAAGVVAIIAFANLSAPGTPPTASAPMPTASPKIAEATPAPSSDPRVVVAPQGTFTIAYADGVLTVSRLNAGVAVPLGGASVPSTVQPAFALPAFRGTRAWTMSCPDIGAGRVRIVFGSIVPARDGQYLGPPASGAVGPDGLFFYVLGPGEIDPGATIGILTRGGQVSIDAAMFDVVLHGGRTPPSGCQVIGQ